MGGWLDGWMDEWVGRWVGRWGVWGMGEGSCGWVDIQDSYHRVSWSQRHPSHVLAGSACLHDAPS